MKKRKSTRETKSMIQTALWLPRDMHEKLKKDGGERGLGEEIRRRLQYAFDAAETPSDEVTDEVLNQIKDIFRDVSRDEPWHANRFAYDVTKAAINALLSNHQPSNEGKPETKAHLQAVYGEEKPENIGRMIARLAIIAYGRERWGKAFLEGPKG
jgi:hypothetical protein